VRDYVTLPNLKNLLNKIGLLKLDEEKQFVSRIIDQLNIVTPSQEQPVQFLSGGNQQKVVFAKLVGVRPKVLFLDEPTQGVDVQAKVEIMKIIDELSRNDICVIVISEEIRELMDLCDRIIVIRGACARFAVNDPAPASEHYGSHRWCFIGGRQRMSRLNGQNSKFSLNNLIWVLLIATIVIFQMLTPRFLSQRNLLNIFEHASVLGIMVIGQSFALLSGNFDLSAESVLGLTALMGAWLVTAAGSPSNGSGLMLNPILTVAIMFGIGGAIGILNGYLITRLKMNNFIVTLALMIILRE
jgi:ABC-type uncharacterized transport system fused permease/ATPase subunit